MVLAWQQATSFKFKIDPIKDRAFQKLQNESPNLNFGWVFQKSIQKAFSIINLAHFELDQGRGLPEAPK